MVSIEQQIAEVQTLSPAQLRSRWRDVFHQAAPPISRDLLARGIAYRIQERAHGGLPRSVEKRIDALSRRVERTGTAADANEINLKSGTRLVRSWNGKTQSVLVCDEGFQFDGRRYGSLTHIARDITGVNWSGPRFFGLTRRKTSRRRGIISG